MLSDLVPQVLPSTTSHRCYYTVNLPWDESLDDVRAPVLYHRSTMRWISWWCQSPCFIQWTYCEMDPLMMSEPLCYTMDLPWDESIDDVRALMIWLALEIFSDIPRGYFTNYQIIPNAQSWPSSPSQSPFNVTINQDTYTQRYLWSSVLLPNSTHNV